MSVLKSDLFKRGFKSWAEKTAVEFRQKLSLLPHTPLPALVLAEHLGVVVCPVSEFPGDISSLQNSGWSALTMSNCVGQKVVVYNSFHASTRQQSDLMHELAHVVCGHKVPDSYKGIAIPSDVRNFNEQDEAEAQYLGGCLQVPREGLVWAFKYQMEKDAIAEHFLASTEMVEYRIRITGIRNQVSRWKW